MHTSWISKTAVIPYKVIGNCQFNIGSNILIRNEVSDVNLICICGGDIESTNHFFFHTPEFIEKKQALFDNNQTIDKMLLSQNKSKLTHSFLYRDPTRKSDVN